MQFGRLLRRRTVGLWAHTNYRLHPDYINPGAIGLSITIIERDQDGWDRIRKGVLESFDENGFKVRPIEGKKKILEAEWGTRGFVFSIIDVDNKIVNDLEDLERTEEEKKRREENLADIAPEPINQVKQEEADPTSIDQPVEEAPKKKQRKPRSDKGKKRGPRKKQSN